MVARARDVPGDRIDGLVLPGEAVGAARIDQQCRRRWPAHRCALPPRARPHWRSSPDAHPRGTRAPGARCARCSAAGRQRCHAAQPPLSTATRSCPSQRSSHHSRAAYRRRAPGRRQRPAPSASMPQRPKVAAQRLRLRQRVAPAAADRGPGKVVVQVRVQRARDVAVAVGRARPSRACARSKRQSITSQCRLPSSAASAGGSISVVDMAQSRSCCRLRIFCRAALSLQSS